MASIWTGRLRNGKDVGRASCESSDGSEQTVTTQVPQYEAGLKNSALLDTLHTLPNLGVCQRRLWSFISTSQGALANLPEICAFLSKHPEIRHDKHLNCTADLCHLDDMDSTKVQQLHMCRDPATCDKMPLFFDPKYNCRFGDDDTEFVSTAWRFDSHGDHFEPAVNDEPYMAVSHVWSDGTGAGLKSIPGQVNPCLFRFFRQFAEKGKLRALWWDAISLPALGDREQRPRALKMMHRNYSKAEFVLIYDRGLAEMDWADDGSPCVALVLSTWFSRGWTALELLHSKKVKVVFSNPEAKINPNADKLIMKDLHDHILSRTQYCSTDHLAHLAASSVIRMIHRDQAGDAQPTFSHVVQTLRSRYTSWPRDRLVITGLLLNIKGFRSDWNRTQMSQQILLQNRGAVTGLSLLHGRVTMQTRGPWSWCPVSVLEFDDFREADPLEIQPNGQIRGSWEVISLQEVQNVIPLDSSHPSVALRINFCLLRWSRRCLLLGSPADRTKVNERRRFLLVVDLRIKNEGYMMCQYVGAVTGWSSANITYSSRLVCLGSEHDMHLSASEPIGNPPTTTGKGKARESQQPKIRGPNTSLYKSMKSKLRLC